MDFTQVVILNGVLIGVEAEITSHRIELHSLQGFDQGFFVFDLAVGGTNGRINQQCRVVALRCVNSGQALVFFFKFRYEFFVCFIGQVKTPVRCVKNTEHVVAHCTNHVLVGTKAGLNEADIFVQACCHELFDEVDAHATR